MSLWGFDLSWFSVTDVLARLKSYHIFSYLLNLVVYPALITSVLVLIWIGFSRFLSFCKGKLFVRFTGVTSQSVIEIVTSLLHIFFTIIFIIVILYVWNYLWILSFFKINYKFLLVGFFRIVGLCAILFYLKYTMDGVLRRILSSNYWVRSFINVRHLLSTFTTLLVGILCIYVILTEFKFSVAPFLTGLGLLSLGLGYAIAPWLQNFFAGLSLLVSKAVRVGDYVGINDNAITGTVILLGAVHMKVQTVKGDVTVVFYKDILTYTNYTPAGLFTVVVDVEIKYSSDIDVACRELVNIVNELSVEEHYRKIILGAGQGKGLVSFSYYGMVIRVSMTINNSQYRWECEREVLRRAKYRFDELNIALADYAPIIKTPGAES